MTKHVKPINITEQNLTMILKSKSECKQTQTTFKVANKHYIWCADIKTS